MARMVPARAPRGLSISRLRIWMPRRSPLAAAAGTIACLLVLAACFAHASLAGEWAGRESTEDGTLHVRNPAEPMNGTATIRAEELWRIGGDTDDENELFGLIARLVHDEEGNIYLLDSQLSEVKVFSPDGAWIRTIGREGEGPGEFRYASGLFFMPDGGLAILQGAPPKIVILTRDGEPAGEISALELGGEGFPALFGGRYAGDRIVLAAQTSHFDQEKGTFTQRLFLAAVDPEGKQLARYHEQSRLWEFANPVIAEKMWDTIQNRWAVGPDGRVYAAVSFDGYRIHVWKPDGALDRIIEREHKTHKRSSGEIEEMRRIYAAFTRQAPNSKLEMEDHDKDITSFHVRDDGTLWVLPSPGARSAGAGRIGTFDVLDPAGRFVQRVVLEGEGSPLEDGYFFVGDRLYVVTDLLQAAIAAQGGGQSDEEEPEEEPEPMAVICYRIDGSRLDLD